LVDAFTSTLSGVTDSVYASAANSLAGSTTTVIGLFEEEVALVKLYPVDWETFAWK